MISVSNICLNTTTEPRSRSSVLALVSFAAIANSHLQTPDHQIIPAFVREAAYMTVPHVLRTVTGTGARRSLPK